MPGPKSIGSDRQLFTDDYWMDQAVGVSRRLHRPEKREAAISPEHPWELGGVSYLVTFEDISPITGAFCHRAWYRCDCEMPPKDRRLPLIAYAESDDGIHWRKPTLNLVPYGGSTENNLVWSGPGNNLAPFRDDRTGVPDEERYKAIVRESGVYALSSSNGLDWRMMQDDPILTDGPFDSHNIAFFDTWKEEYVAYTRGVAGTGNFKGGVRWIRRATSSDFINWSSLEPIDAGDAPFEHLYTNACIQYERAPGTYLMFPSRFVPEREPVPNWPYGAGVSDIVLMSSRDGIHFDRSFMEAFVRPGPDQENWHERGIFMERGLIHTSPVELSLYGMEHWRMPDVCIRRYALRTDGFVSVNADARGGEFTTPVFTFSGDTLRLNYATSAIGTVRVEIQDENGRPIPGRSLGHCTEKYGDEIDGMIEWTDGSDLSPWSGAPVKLRITLSDADVYAYRFDRLQS